MTLTITPKKAPLGAEVTGIDLGAPIDPDTAIEIKAALCQHGVLVIPDQELTPEAQVALTRLLGEPDRHVISECTLPGMPEVFIVSNVRKDDKPVGAINTGQYWHSDLSYNARPTFASMLHAKELPSRGGETLFASMVRAYETLDEDLKAKIDGRRAIHDYMLAFETVFAANPDRSLSADQQAQVPPVEHPVVRTQTETGRKALYVNPGFTRRIVGMEESASRKVLEALFAHAADDANIYTHYWRMHDFLIWDNRITMHKALDNYTASERRHMLRTSVTGEVPV